jgi:hypothetical protein
MATQDFASKLANETLGKLMIMIPEENIRDTPQQQQYYNGFSQAVPFVTARARWL